MENNHDSSCNELSNPYWLPAPYYTWRVQDLVKALHAAGLGIILDVVFNHTSEGGASGPAIHFKTLLDDIFYHHDGLYYRDYTGCGNTINCNHPLVTHFLVMRTIATVLIII